MQQLVLFTVVTPCIPKKKQRNWKMLDDRTAAVVIGVLLSVSTKAHCHVCLQPFIWAPLMAVWCF